MVIQAVAAALLDSVRPMDLVARIGGEEFAIILPSCASAFGETVAERIRRRVERMPVAVGAGQQIAVSVSVGGAFAPQWVRSTPALWVERADQQLYRAKAMGRNLVQLEAAAVSIVSTEEKRLLFDSTGFQDFE
jgi:diguanylate cyclase